MFCSRSRSLSIVLPHLMLVVAKVGRKREEKAPRRAFCWVSSFDTSSWFLCGQSGVAVAKTQEAFYLKLQQKLTDHTAGSSCCTTCTCKQLVIHLKWDQNIISTHLCMASNFPFWAEHSCTKCSFHKRCVYIVRTFGSETIKALKSRRVIVTQNLKQNKPNLDQLYTFLKSCKFTS